VSSEIEKVPPNFWILVAVLTVLLVPITILWVFLQSGQCLLALGITSGTTFFMPITYILLLVFLAFKKFGFLKRHINSLTMTYLYALTVAMMSMNPPACADLVYHPPAYWYTLAVNPKAPDYVPPWFGPSVDTAKLLIRGGVPISWIEWIPPILWWWLLYAICGLLMIGIASVLRYDWIDVERIPYPHTTPAHLIITLLEPEKFGHISKEAFAIGSIIGFLFVTVMFMIINFPWFPDIYGWRVNTCSSGLTYVTPGSPLAPIVAFIGVNKNPLFVAIAYLVPLTTLFNAWFFYLVFAILIQVAYYFGYYTGVPEVGGCGRAYACPERSILFLPPFQLQVFESLGLCSGIFVSYLFIRRKYILETLKAALGMKNSLSNVEKNEPIKYRYAWMLIMVSSILLFIFLSICGVGPLPAITLMFVLVMYHLVWARTWGLSGFYAPSGFYAAPGYFRWIWPVDPVPMTKEWSITMGFAIDEFTNAPYDGFGTLLYGSFAAFAEARKTGADLRYIFKILIIMAIVVPLLALLTYIAALHTWGYAGSPLLRGTYHDLLTWFSPEFVSSMPALGEWRPTALAGFITAMVLMYLHSRFIWFPFEPVGFLVGISNWNLQQGIWLSAAIAWILKVLTLKIGGSRAYENYGVPTACGVMIGYSIGVLAVGIVGIYRFFFPF